MRGLPSLRFKTIWQSESVLILLAGLAWPTPPSPLVRAAAFGGIQTTIYVNATNDENNTDGDGSLREPVIVANSLDRVLKIGSTTAQISDLTVQDGDSGSGGGSGILVYTKESLTLINRRVTANASAAFMPIGMRAR